MSKIILTSYGLTSIIGRKHIAKEIKKDIDLQGKTIFLFHEPYLSIEQTLKKVCVDIGFKSENIFLAGCDDMLNRTQNADYVYITEGNSFEILALLRKYELIVPIREAVLKKGATYLGASAGAMIAGASIEEAYCMDRNYVRLDDFEGLKLFDGIVLPHYTLTERNRYIANSPGLKERYKHIYNVKNDGILVLEI